MPGSPSAHLFRGSRDWPRDGCDVILCPAHSTGHSPKSAQPEKGRLPAPFYTGGHQGSGVQGLYHRPAAREGRAPHEPRCPAPGVTPPSTSTDLAQHTGLAAQCGVCDPLAWIREHSSCDASRVPLGLPGTQLPQLSDEGRGSAHPGRQHPAVPGPAQHATSGLPPPCPTSATIPMLRF